MLTQENVGKDFATQNRKFCNTHTKRFAFYQAGRCLVHTLLFNHPKISLLKLAESDNLVCSTQEVPKQYIGQGLSPIETQIDLETLLIGLYAGKAGERFTDNSNIKSDLSFSSLKCKDKPVTERLTYQKRVFARRTQRKHLVHVNGLFANGSTFRAKRDLEMTVELSQRRYICGTLFELGIERLALQSKFGKKETDLIYPKQIVTSKPGVQNCALMPYQNKVLVRSSSGCAKAKLEQKAGAFGTQKELFRFKKTFFFGTTDYQKFGCAKTKFLQDNGTIRKVQYAKSCSKSGSYAGISSSSLFFKAQSVFNNKGITPHYCFGVYGQPKSLLPLQYVISMLMEEKLSTLVEEKFSTVVEDLLCKQHQICLLSLGNFLLHNQLDHFKIEPFLWQSDTGLFERMKAALLVKSLLLNGSIYLPNLFNLQKNNRVGDLNKIEIQDKKSFDLLKDLEEQATSMYLRTDKQNQSLHSKNFYSTHSYKNKKGLITKARSVTELLNSQVLQYEIFVSQLNKSSQATPLLFSKKIDSLSQKKERSVWCEENVCKPLTSSIKRYGHWFRIYLPQIETDQQLAKTSFLHSVSLDQFFKKRRELGFSEYIKIRPLHAYSVKDLGTLPEQNRSKIASFSALPFYTPSKISLLSVLPVTPTKFLDQVNCYYNFSCKVPTTKFRLPEQVSLVTRCTAPKTRFLSGLQEPQVSNKFESVAQLEVPPHLRILPETFKNVWPQELGYGLCHKLVLNAFSRSLNLLNKNRELLDILADHLIRFGKIRVPEISRICSLYVETDHKSFHHFS